MAHVKIGPSFFRKERNEYSNHIRAFVREAGQNGIDAKGSDELIFRVWTDSDLGTTIVRFSNNGTPMTREVLENKLLSIGESGKNFEDGAVGGMGKAKLLLYFMHAKYTIRTGNLLVEGCGGEYSIREVSDFMDGTSSEVYWNEDVTDRLAKACHWFAQYLQWHGTMYVNDQKVDTNLRKGSPRREFSWGKVYTNKSFSNTLLVRISGIPMFSRYISHKGMVVVELTGTSGDRLTSNRDGLRYEYSSELDELINQLAVDKRSALRERQAEIRRFEGERLKNEAKQPKAAGNILDVLAGPQGEQSAQLERIAAFVRTAENEYGPGHGGITERVTNRRESRTSIGPQFFVKNTTGMSTPDYYVPGSLFSDYSRRLALAWGNCLLEMHRLLNISGEFSIGFLFDEGESDEDSGSLAESDPGGSDGQIYYISPARVVKQKDKPQCRSFKAAYKGAWVDRFAIISIAIHELVHGAYHLSQHDEDYSSKLTEVTGKLLPHMSRLSALFRS